MVRSLNGKQCWLAQITSVAAKGFVYWSRLKGGRIQHLTNNTSDVSKLKTYSK
ncbi:hypothetical protein S140_85 [Shewanella sp. phage 1/40]|uniref:hypothetical protein n=1 Tax=Shewanella phage 1/4 TaxID=1458859 RepID=UPI0004F5DEA4|nr:hypothetical protein S14_84 [Shewanella sp. phage 1/4]YP_009104083.1 hypothetical protein S140_85 [Shewanella sp. phage 1/40]AHK11193.1 hypothetical protein S14_84 [Shewanella sp. phage 1/4]AHK11492.1 hypothetical protein S140_85 [Shewanella sp. phage 1/40]